ncbi:MAG: hypothetical protein S4CHLAM45_09990 [Chlamydiales bacterium]|nr:hypothetical protein [Chlamydiales bacterium]MCH9620185.1 hypothetical protein [Chlamydiales bacterium]MCH9623100.1 hypothetical protein [Chlamydiales bacterium]
MLLKKILLLLLLTGCSLKEQNSNTYSVEKYVMDMPLCVQVEKKGDLDSIINQTFDEVDRIYNNWNPSSEISDINNLKAFELFEVSPQLALFLGKVDQIVHLTEGRFDPTVNALQKLWKKELKRGKIPSDEQIATAQEGLGWSKVHLKGSTLYKENSQTTLDLSGIAKGYAVDLLAERLYDAGFKSVYVNWGGEIRTLGLHPSGREWRIALLGTEVVKTINQAIATSGSYLQLWKVEGKFYTHLIDPFKKEPLYNHPLSSASVLLEDCMTADAIATTLMLFNSVSEGEEWFKRHFPHGEAWIIEDASSRDPSLVSSLFQP